MIETKRCLADCCQSDVGAAYQAQGYNIIKQLDPYHAVMGASDCGDVWTFFDNAVTCTYYYSRNIVL